MNTHCKTLRDNSKEIITICSICHSIKLDGQWLSSEKAKLRIDVAKLILEMRVSHGLCKTCLSEFYEYQTKTDMSDIAQISKSSQSKMR